MKRTTLGAWLSALLIVATGTWMLTSCGSDDNASASMQLVAPAALADDINRVELTVFDENTTCSGANAVGGTALPDLEAIELSPMDTQTLFMSAGLRVFFARAYDNASTALARGCAPKTLVEGETTSVTITFTAYPDAGTGDASTARATNDE